MKKQEFIYKAIVTTLALSIPLGLAAGAVEKSATSASLVQQSAAKQEAIASQKILYVNPELGADAPGAGASEASAFRSITYALQQAESGTTIELALGQYKAESFPIKLKPGVILKGNETQQGLSVELVGGGDYASLTFASQNATIVAAENSQIIGVTVTNPNTRGTGVWVEDTKITIRNSTFTNNDREGIFAGGGASVKIENNQFINNGGNGIAVAGETTGEIRGNIFQATGYGLAIGGKARPTVVQNQIRENRTGAIVTQEARPLFQWNIIENNREYGILAIADAKLSLSNNKFHSNGLNDWLIADTSSNSLLPPEDIEPELPESQQSAWQPAQEPAQQRPSTIFKCVAQGSGFATIAQRGAASVPQPMIVWNRSLGPDWTPEKRCQQVTARLNQKVAANGGSLDNLLFTVGTVNDSMVVCLFDATQESGCSAENMLFTLSPENAKSPAEVLRRLITFSVTGSASPVNESRGLPYVELQGINDNLEPEAALWFVRQGQ